MLQNERTGGVLSGTIHVVDPSPFNWLYVLFNTMEEPVKADKDGRIVPSLASELNWIDETVLEMKLRKGVAFHNGQPFTSQTVKENFIELQRWLAPHPPGTWLNFHEETTLKIIDEYTVQFHFPYPDGLALGKMRGNHMGNSLFWRKLGFGYAKQGSGEGHW